MLKILFALSFFTLPAFAAVAEWTSLLRAAESNHPNVRASRADEESAESLATAARGGFFPAVSLFAERKREENWISLLGVESESKLTTDIYGVKAKWNLFKGFETVGQARRAKAQWQGARAGLSATWLDVQVELRRAYDDALLATESARVYEGLQKRYRDQLKVIEAKYRSGLEAQWAVELARSNLILVEANLSAEKLNLEKSLQTLGRLTGQTYDRARPDVRFEKSPQPTRPIFRSEDHPALRQAEANGAMAAADVTVTQSTFWPAVDLTWETGRARPEGQDPSQKTAYSFVVSYPLFEGFSGVATDSAARARRRAAEIRLDETRKVLHEQEDQLWRQLDINRQQLTAREIELRGARAYADATSLQYRLGARKFAEWDTAQSRLLQAERDFLGSRRLWLSSYADWEKAAGLSEENL